MISAIIRPDDDVIIPRGSKMTDLEVEHGVVIGKGGAYYINEADAMDHVAGFSVTNDISERELQIERSGHGTKIKTATPLDQPVLGWSPQMKLVITTHLHYGLTLTMPVTTTGLPCP
ncbi:MAG: 2-keto-4-pentenoate hydratase/2-oxohepta-3-ene-1,7-dioic acid hydratase in catechol pathway [Alteromonas macleodii]